MSIFFLNFFQRLFSKFGSDYGYAGNPLIDIQVAHSKELILLTNQKLKIKNMIKKASILVKEKTEFKIEDLGNKLLDVIKLMGKIKLLLFFMKKEKKKELKKCYKLLEKIKKLQKKLDKINQKIHKEKTLSKEIKSVFVTFQTSKDRYFFYDLLGYSWSHRFRKCLKKNQGFFLGNKMIYAKKPPQPVNINWKNYSLRKNKKLKRRLLSWSVYILLYLLRKIHNIN